jgi:hypothetical protein
VDSEGLIFDFETDFAGTLVCIPMSVRLKLDVCGVKVSLKQWNRFPPDDRQRLLRTRCETPEETKAYKELLLTLIGEHANSAPEYVAVDPAPEWSDTSRVPPRIVAYAAAMGRKPPLADQWRTLSPLKRFTLYKLTRPNHENDNFIPAMQEFGLIDG